MNSLENELAALENEGKKGGRRNALREKNLQKQIQKIIEKRQKLRNEYLRNIEFDSFKSLMPKNSVW